MSGIPEGFQYTEEHEYVREADTEGEFLIGITDYAQGELGDVVFVELPAPGDAFEKMEVFGTIEAVKAVSDLFSPISGEVVAINETLEEDPALVNSDPYGEGWMIRVRATDPSEMDDLLTPEAYAALIED
ncbi:MAG: glycine cleavage system protein GcvH [Gemmatimonadetes bacterium]|nr:glycine cleavage system protein GcvH [Gemmatimonadota bacterium]MBT8477789.1 glycine cleavage system protein GcvH [Gemmatimonadota bacterium]NNK49297.1 glycine cleavage system protein GcvH [Gemmatimonadota bacterium]